VVLLLATFAVSTAAHDQGCELELRQAQIEDVPPLPGWVWREIEIAPSGWRGRLEWAGGDLLAASFAISCVADPAGLFERQAEIRRFVGVEEIELERIVGNETVAWHDSETATTHLEWRSGGTIGEVVGEWNASVAELAATALGLETARSSSEPQ
jgi:hypothetical protein